MLVGDKFKIESDSLNVTLYYKHKPRQASQSENWRPEAYFSNPHNALHYLVEKEIMGTGMADLKTVIEKIIDFGKGTVTILHLKTRIRLSCPKCKVRLAKRHQFCPGCGEEVNQATKRQQEQRRIRTLPVDNCTMLMLKDYISNRPASSGTSELTFRLNRHRAWQIVRDCASKAGLPNLVNPETGRVRGVSPHRLRDAFSVHAMKFDDSGDALRLLQEHLGHASFNTTARYRKIAGDEHRKWYDSLWGQSA